MRSSAGAWSHNWNHHHLILSHVHFWTPWNCLILQVPDLESNECGYFPGIEQGGEITSYKPGWLQHSCCWPASTNGTADLALCQAWWEVNNGRKKGASTVDLQESLHLAQGLGWGSWKKDRVIHLKWISWDTRRLSQTFIHGFKMQKFLKTEILILLLDESAPRSVFTG